MERKEQFNNYVCRFGEWLKSVKGYKKSVVSSRLANIRKIGESYDILKEFSIDKCQGILDELRFSKNDHEPKTSIVINGNYYNGLATYRQTLGLFVCFLEDISYAAPAVTNPKAAIFIGSFNEFKRYVGPKCRNEVNLFCKNERKSHKGICEYCGEKHVLQSAHIVERPIIIKEILDKYYLIGEDLYEVPLEDFFLKFKNAHMPISDHIFFLCKNCHNKLDNEHSITIADLKNKRHKV